MSPALEVALIGAGVAASKIRVHPAFVASEVRPGDLPLGFADIRARYPLLLSYAHHPSPVYGRALLLDGLQALGKAGTLAGLVAFGPGSRSVEFRGDVEQRGLRAQVIALGDVSHGTALAVMKASDLFVRPTLADGDSVSVREALAVGVPCVASDAAVRPSGVSTFRSGDALDLARALQGPHGSAGETVQPDAGEWLMAEYEKFAKEPRWSFRGTLARFGA